MADFVTGKDIARLNHDAFRKVMNSVIIAEADVAGVSLTGLDLTTRDTDPDGGVDGRLQWPDNAPHELLAAGNTVVQYKSGKLTDAELKKEFVKPGVIKTLKQGGNYILFVGHDYVDPTRKQRLKTLKALCKSKNVALSRCKIVYGDQLARWVSRHIGVVILPELEKGLPSFVTIETLSRSRNLRNPYRLDDARREIIERIRQFVKQPTGDGVIRIEGPAGVGKTRVLLEALNVTGISERALYCANAEDPNAQQLVASLCNQPHARAIIVLDECDSERQQALKSYSELTDGRVILVCAGVTDVLFQAPMGLGSTFTLLPLVDDDIRSILQQHTKDAPDEIVNTAVRLSGGYVKLAIFVFTILLQVQVPLQDLAKLDNIRQFLQRFISDSTFKTLKVFSLLAKVGWLHDRRKEAESLANELSLPISDMESAVVRLRDQGVIIERGYSLYVSPDLLAISCAAAMWEEKGPELIKIVTTLQGTGPKRQLLRRLATMHEHPTVIEAVNVLLGPNGLYRNIDDLDHGFLSEIFRFFASTLPPSALAVLERLIPDTPIDRLRSFSEGRREVIWAIESLLRWPATSLRAARILIRLALSENESIANNATGITGMFFHAFLSGSPLPLRERLTLVEEILLVGGSDARLLAVRAAASSLAFHESRMGGDTDPISKRPYPKEWRPSNWEELWDARRFAISLLWKIAEGTDQAASDAHKQLLSSLSTLARDGQANDAISILQSFHPLNDDERVAFLEAVHRISKMEGLRLTDGQTNVLTSLRESVFSGNLFDQIRRWAGKRTWFDYDLDGAGFAKVEETCVRLAEQTFTEGLSEDAWEWLASPAAENIWSFGRQLGLLDKKNSFLKKIISVSPKNLNAMLLSSYLSGRSDDERDDILDELAKSEQVLAFVATWRNSTTDRSGTRILNLMDGVPPQLWGVLRYGSWMKPLPDANKVSILQKMLNRPESTEAGSSLMMHLASDNPLWARTHQELLWQALSVFPVGVSSEWEWGQLARVAVNVDSKHLAKLALQYLLEDNDVHLNSHPVVQALAEATTQKPAEVWKIVGPALAKKSSAAYRLLLSLRHWYGELIPFEDLKKFAKRFGKRGRILVSELISVTAPLPDKARDLIRAFPEDNDLLNIFAGHLFSGSWTGPMSSHTEAILSQIALLERDQDPRVSAWASRLRVGASKQLEQEKLMEEDEQV